MRKLWNRKFRITTFALLLLVGSVAAPAAFVTATLQGAAPPGQAQDASHKAAHTTLKGFYGNVAVLPPVTVTDITGNRLEYLYVDGGLNLGSLDLEPGYSIIPKGFDALHHRGCYGVHYCRQHLIVLDIEEIAARFCRKAGGP